MITVPVLVKAAVKSSAVKASGLTKKAANAGFGMKVVRICDAGSSPDPPTVSEVLPLIRLPVASVMVGLPVGENIPAPLAANVVTPEAASS